MAEKSKKTTFSVEFNVSAVDLPKWRSVTSAANKLKVIPKIIRQWKKNETALKEAAGTKITSRCRVAGGGRKLFSDSLDKRLKEWYDETFENRFAIS